MISDKSLVYTFHDEHMDRCAKIIERSGVVELIDQFYRERRGDGGRSSTGRIFTLLGVLTAGLAIICLGRVPSIAEIYRVLCELPDDQLARVGMDPAQRGLSTSYPAFWGWLTRRLEPLDSGSDLPARRVTNQHHHAQIEARSAEQQQASDLAKERLHIVMNRIIAASIEDLSPPGGRGDVVIDESIVMLAGVSNGLGSRDDKHRAAAYAGRFFVRDRVDNSVSAGEKVRSQGKSGVGIGITAVSRVGPPADLYSISSVITAVAIHYPTSASIEGARLALEMHRFNGLDQRSGSRSRLPYLTVDMGYNQKRKFNDLCLDLGFSPVVRYPSSWTAVLPVTLPSTVLGGLLQDQCSYQGIFIARWHKSWQAIGS